MAAEFFSRRSRKLEQMTWFDALIVGIFQAFSIFPGISRSGSTITGGMLRHLERPAAARFAFLMSIPVMLAAGIFSLPDLLEVPDLGSFLPILSGWVHYRRGSGLSLDPLAAIFVNKRFAGLFRSILCTVCLSCLDPLKCPAPLRQFQRVTLQLSLWMSLILHCRPWFH